VKLLIRFVITAVALYCIAVYVPGFRMNGWGDAAIAAVIFGIVNAVIGPILKLISLPLTILTIGLFSIVINWILFALTHSGRARIETLACRPWYSGVSPSAGCLPWG